MKWILITSCLILGCVAPDRTYNVLIDCQGEGHTININVKADAPQDYNAEANAETDVGI